MSVVVKRLVQGNEDLNVAHPCWVDALNFTAEMIRFDNEVGRVAVYDISDGEERKVYGSSDAEACEAEALRLFNLGEHKLPWTRWLKKKH